MSERNLVWTVRQGEHTATGSTPTKALAALRDILPDYPKVVIPAQVVYSDPVSNRQRKGGKMARVVKYDVQSDLSGKDIAAGNRCIVRFEYDDEKIPNYTADLDKKEADEMREHVHARPVTPRVRKPAEAEAEAA